MNAIRLIALLLLATSAQGVSATTIWLKDGSGQVCKNSLSTNAGQVIGLGGVIGSVLTLTISNPAGGVMTPNSGQCLNLPSAPAATPLVFTGSVTPQMLPIHMWKPGTKGAMECLDQGNNLSGVIGLLISGQYRLNLGGGYTDGCNMQTQTKITSNGLPIFTRTASLKSGELGGFNGAYHIFNEANPVPEPGSLFLLVAGAAGLLLVGMQRRRLVKQA